VSHLGGVSCQKCPSKRNVLPALSVLRKVSPQVVRSVPLRVRYVPPGVMSFSKSVLSESGLSISSEVRSASPVKSYQESEVFLQDVLSGVRSVPPEISCRGHESGVSLHECLVRSQTCPFRSQECPIWSQECPVRSQECPTVSVPLECLLNATVVLHKLFAAM
jgi:hypothetical protein